jgi:Lar family restriction alleviation protein
MPHEDRGETMSDLKPCPFCGHEAKGYSNMNWYSIKCTFCDASSGISESGEDALKAWNTRLALSSLIRDIKDLIACSRPSNPDPLRYQQIVERIDNRIWQLDPGEAGKEMEGEGL